MAGPITTPPTVDITALVDDPSGTAARACANAVHEACRTIGFVVVEGHGLDRELEALLAAARAFFDLPQVDKERIPRRNRYGYVPHRDAAIDTARASNHTEYLDLDLHGDIPFPAVAGFGTAVRVYQLRALHVAGRLLRGLTGPLALEPDFFTSRMAEPECKLRLLHYPQVAPGEGGALPVPNTPHTDYGLLTLLATDGVPGLEVKPKAADWTPVVAPAGGLVVNLGDMLARWTNDLYRSTPHRVVGPAVGDRISIPFFVNPDPATVVDCIPSCVTPARPCRYPPVTAGEFLAARIDGTDEPYVDPTEGPVRRVGT